VEVVKFGGERVGVLGVGGEFLQECGELGGVFAGAVEFGQGVFEFGSQARLAGGFVEEAELGGKFSEQVAEDHLSAEPGDLRDGAAATFLEDVVAERVEGGDTYPEKAGEGAGAGEVSFGSERGLAGEDPENGRAERLVFQGGDDGVEAVVRFAGAGAAYDELNGHGEPKSGTIGFLTGTYQWEDTMLEGEDNGDASQ
jgi:hypothetical protein